MNFEIACLAVIVFVLIWYNLKNIQNVKEKITNRVNTISMIRRAVGFDNDADEIPVASGVIHSAPILDYSHTYWDGARYSSCDQCSNGIICPNCPQYHDSARISTANDYIYDSVQLNKENLKENLLAWDANATQISDYVTDGCGLQHDIDDDAEYKLSREFRGACATRNSLKGRSEIRSDLLHISDVTFDRAGELALNNTKGKCGKGKSSVINACGKESQPQLADVTRAIYMDRMGLGPLRMSPVDFTYLGYNDRVYKDQFDLQNQVGCSYTV